MKKYDTYSKIPDITNINGRSRERMSFSMNNGAMDRFRLIAVMSQKNSYVGMVAEEIKYLTIK